VVGGAFRLGRWLLGLLREQMRAGVGMVELSMGVHTGVTMGDMEGMEGMAEGTVEDMAEGMAEGMAVGMAADIMEGTERMVEVIMGIGTKHQRQKSSLGEGVWGR